MKDPSTLRSLFVWVVFYGFVVCNLGSQLIYLLVTVIGWVTCTEYCYLIWPRYLSEAPQRLLWSSVFAPIVFFIAWVIGYLSKRLKNSSAIK